MSSNSPEHLASKESPTKYSQTNSAKLNLSFKVFVPAVFDRVGPKYLHVFERGGRVGRGFVCREEGGYIRGREREKRVQGVVGNKN